MRKRRTVILEFDGKEYEVKEGDTFLATIDVKMEPVNGRTAGTMDVSGYIRTGIVVKRVI